jgi:hypothetical protein
VRNTLVAALVDCADRPRKLRARRFLLGLSADELQFIAEFFGACILESGDRCGQSRAELAARIARFQQSRSGCRGVRSADREDKAILLLEYLCRGQSAIV